MAGKIRGETGGRERWTGMQDSTTLNWLRMRIKESKVEEMRQVSDR